MVDQLTTPQPPKKQPQETTYTHWAVRLTDENFHVNEVPKFTLIKDLLRALGAKKYAFQMEKGENGVLHWQIAFSCGKPCRMRRTKVREQLMKLGNFNFPNGDYCENAKSQAYEHYSQKSDTRVEGPWVFGMPIPYLGQDLITEDMMYDWQIGLLQIVKQRPHSRQIHWVCDKDGKVGKSSMTKYLAYHYNALKCGGAKKDIYMAAGETDIYIVDLPRTVEERVPYEAIEELKNGHVFSGKYESCQKLFPIPHVIIFANFLPDFTAMSSDRWNVWFLKKFEDGEILHTQMTPSMAQHRWNGT